MYVFLTPLFAMIFLFATLDVPRFLVLLFFMLLTLGGAFFSSMLSHTFMLFWHERLCSSEVLVGIQIKNLHYYLDLATLMAVFEGIVFWGCKNSRMVAWLALFFIILVPSLVTVGIYNLHNVSAPRDVNKGFV